MRRHWRRGRLTPRLERVVDVAILRIVNPQRMHPLTVPAQRALRARRAELRDRA
jgi:hypothetical protein